MLLLLWTAARLGGYIFPAPTPERTFRAPARTRALDAVARRRSFRAPARTRQVP